MRLRAAHEAVGDASRVIAERFARAHPDRVLAARRGADGRWIEITYARMLERARALGQGLVDLGLSAERPLAVL
ncbi:feruloyl-CoA synthase, partial [Burkholderia cenocepacia]|nr:feruloyl-CoA synthase [Burkholderia cenocepacia]